MLIFDPLLEAVEVELVVVAALEHHNPVIRRVLEVAQADCASVFTVFVICKAPEDIF